MGLNQRIDRDALTDYGMFSGIIWRRLKRKGSEIRDVEQTALILLPRLSTRPEIAVYDEELKLDVATK